MTYFAITAQYPVFTDTDGTPLENGYIYIGQQGANPITNPLTAYWDDGLLYPAGQPIRTLAGAPNRNGSPAPIFVPGEFSILVRDKNGVQVYYSATGIKNYTAATLEDRRNYMINGDFSVFQRGLIPDRWQFIESGWTGTYVATTFVQTDSVIDTNPRAYMKLDNSGSSALASDELRYVHIIEDVSIFSGKNIILSFYAKAGTDGRTKFATSIDMLKSSALTSTAYYSQGLGVTTHNLTADWMLYTVIVSLPKIANTGGEFIPDFTDSGLVINLWLLAGTDYDDQTNSLGYETGELHITDLRVNLGTQRITGNDRTWEEEFELCQRYYEKSYSYDVTPGAVNNDGRVFLAAANADEFLPSQDFLKSKRHADPTITIYSPQTLNKNGFVWRIGTGDIAVAFTEPSQNRIEYIELGVVKTDGDNYSYHFTADAEFTL